MRFIFILLLLLFVTPLTDIHAAQQQDHVFRKIYKMGYKGNYVITGEAKVNSVFYTVEDGHVQYIREKKVTLKGDPSKWRPFKIMINIPDSTLPENGTVVVTLYEHNAKKSIVHPLPIVLEQFYHW